MTTPTRSIRTRALAVTLAVTLTLTLVLVASFLGGASASTFVSGNVSGVWNEDDDPYIVTGTVTIPAGQQLVIAPTVRVKFAAGQAMLVYGTLVSLGTSFEPVTFTSVNDPDGSPAPGDWQAVFAEDGSVVDLDYTQMRYGGSGGYGNLSTYGGTAASVSWLGGGSGRSSNDGIRIRANNISLSNLTIVENGADGVEITPTNQPVLENLGAYDNVGYAFRVMANPMSFSNTLTGVNNGIDGIYVAGTIGGSFPAQTCTWANNPGMAYVIDGTVTCSSSDTLELGAGAVVKMNGTSAYLNVSGAGAHLRTLGNPGARCIITSLKDDAASGDTNGDANATTPAPGDWYAVNVDNGASADLQTTDMLYGGANSSANLWTYSGFASSIVWNGGETRKSANDGIRVTCTNASILTASAFDNIVDGFEINSTNPPTFGHGLVMSRNGGYAMRVTANPGHFPGNWNGADNGVNGIYVTGALGGTMPDQRWIWEASNGLPFVVGGVLQLATADTLHIPSGVVKFGDTSSYLWLNSAGAMLRTGTSGPVWFTSLKNDAVGGDTNGDGAASSPANGDWYSVFLNDGTRGELTNTNFSYGGANGPANLSTYSGTAASLVWNGGGTFNSITDGMRVTATTMSLSNLEASANTIDGLELLSSVPPAMDQIVANNNGAYGIRIIQNPGSLPGTLSGSGNGTNGIWVGGTIGGAQPDQKWTWGANPAFPYVLAGAVTCNGLDTLEIAAGAIVKPGGPSSYFWFNSGAVLRTLGTSNNPVWITSLNDDAHGGDTNGDGGATSPARGDWYCVFLNDGTRGELNNTFFSYGGASGSANLSTYSGTTASLVWNGGGTFNSINDGMRVTATTMSISNLEASGSAVDGLELVSSVPAALDQIVANDNGAYGIRIIQNPGSLPGTISGSGNGTNGIWVGGTIGGAQADQKWTWGANPAFPYVLAGAVTCNGLDTLEIAAGAIVKPGGPSSYFWFNSGAVLRTLGTSDNPVWITSLNDDAQGGDTNGNGAANAPAPGDWYSVFMNTGARAELNETWIAYGGASGSANLATFSGSGGITWNGGGSIYSSTRGIAGSFTTFDLDRVRVANNNGRGIDVSPSAGASANNCDIYENDNAASSYGFVNAVSSVTVDATSSWWGDATGPFDPSPGPPSINAGGLGERVSDYVNYGSWLSAPNTNQPPTSFALVAPASGAEVMPFNVTFVWRAASDPEGTTVSYDLLVDDNPAFASPLVSVTGIADTTYNAGDIGGETGPLYWRVVARDTGGGARQSAPAAAIFTFPAGTGVGTPGDADAAVPVAFHVGHPAPSPTRGASTIAFDLPRDGVVRIDVFDVSGRRVRTLVDDSMRSGTHAAAWDGSNSDGRHAAAGVYFFRVASGADVATRRVVLAR